MKTASYILLPYTAHGTASTKTSNYNGTDENFSGDSVKAAAYYTKNTGVQTVSWFLNNFEGTVIIEGTLDSEADSDNYFQIGERISSMFDAVIQTELVQIEEDITLEVKDTGPRLSKYLSPAEREKIIASYKARKLHEAKLTQVRPPETRTVEIQVYPSPVTPTPITENKALNIEGNYTWIRARVENFTAGEIKKVVLGY